MKFSQVNSLSELFTFWGNKADKYSALNRLREYYDEQKDILMEPYYRELFKYAEKHGAESITAEVRDSLYSNVKEDIGQLLNWYENIVREIVDHYDSK